MISGKNGYSDISNEVPGKYNHRDNFSTKHRLCYEFDNWLQIITVQATGHIHFLSNYR